MTATSLPDHAAAQVRQDRAASLPTIEQVTRALDGVQDPEIHRPITELGMVKNVEVRADGTVRVDVWLTVSGCPLRDTITRDVRAAVGKLAGVASVQVELDVMSEEQRRELQGKLRGGKAEREIPFASPASLTKVYAVASGKGGVGKSTVTVNLADVYWGDLDVLLLDLPPGTGDVAISAGHLVPGAELIVVTTPQLAAAEVAERAGSLATQLHQRVFGVIENMSYLPCPHCQERIEVFGNGGGQAVAQALTRLTGATVPMLGEVPIDLDRKST